MTERDDFDKIVEGLELDLSFVDEPVEPVEEPEPAWSPRTDDDDRRRRRRGAVLPQGRADAR